MNVRPLAALCSVIVIFGGVPIITVAAAAPVAAPAPPPEDNLRLVSSPRLQRLYLAPGADFSHITGVILEPTEVAFRDNWVRDFNRSQRGGLRLTDSRAEAIRNEASTGMGDVFARAFRNAGYQLVQTPGPGVLRIHPYLINLAITAPDVARAGGARIWSRDAGEGMLVLEVFDSRSNALLARALDRRIISGTRLSLRNGVTNRADFRRMFETWARSTVEDLGALKAASAPAH